MNDMSLLSWIGPLWWACKLFWWGSWLGWFVSLFLVEDGESFLMLLSWRLRQLTYFWPRMRTPSLPPFPHKTKITQHLHHYFSLKIARPRPNKTRSDPWKCAECTCGSLAWRGLAGGGDFCVLIRCYRCWVVVEEEEVGMNSCQNKSTIWGLAVSSFTTSSLFLPGLLFNTSHNTYRLKTSFTEHINKCQMSMLASFMNRMCILLWGRDNGEFGVVVVCWHTPRRVVFVMKVNILYTPILFLCTDFLEAQHPASCTSYLFTNIDRICIISYLCQYGMTCGRLGQVLEEWFPYLWEEILVILDIISSNFR